MWFCFVLFFLTLQRSSHLHHLRSSIDHTMNPIVYYGIGPACYRSTSNPLRSTQANKVSRILDVVTISAKAISLLNIALVEIKRQSLIASLRLHVIVVTRKQTCVMPYRLNWGIWEIIKTDVPSNKLTNITSSTKPRFYRSGLRLPLGHKWIQFIYLS